MSFNFVLQIWNLHNAVEVIKTLTPLAVNETVVPVAVEELNDPKFMHWSLLPEQYIKKIIKVIALEKKANSHAMIEWGIIAMAKMLLSFNKQRDHDKSKLMEQLKNFTLTQDKHRGIDLGDYIPGLASFFR